MSWRMNKIRIIKKLFVSLTLLVFCELILLQLIRVYISIRVSRVYDTSIDRSSPVYIASLSSIASASLLCIRETKRFTPLSITIDPACLCFVSLTCSIDVSIDGKLIGVICRFD